MINQNEIAQSLDDEGIITILQWEMANNPCEKGSNDFDLWNLGFIGGLKGQAGHLGMRPAMLEGIEAGNKWINDRLYLFQG
ncbi:MAG: hypothetical protein AAF327_18040 [Cyanobacteria bacterium P01_A01_bin.37]